MTDLIRPASMLSGGRQSDYSSENEFELRDLPKRAWANLPALVVSSSVVSAFAALVEIFTPGISPLSVLAWAIVPGPFFGALIAQSVDVAIGIDVPAWSLPRYLRLAWRIALTSSVPAGVAGSCFLVALEMVTRSGSPWLFVPLGVSGTATTLLLVAAMVRVPVGLLVPQLRGWRLTLFALHTVARFPLPIIGTLSVVIVFVLAAENIAASLILLLPGPLAVILVAAAVTSALHTRGGVTVIEAMALPER